MAVRCAAAATQQFASSIAPHITTLLVHGKQVTRGGRGHCFCMLLFIYLSRLSETSPSFPLTGEHASLTSCDDDDDDGAFYINVHL